VRGRPPGPSHKTLALIEEAHAVLEAHRPMTLRQLHYQLVSKQVIENTQSQYGALMRAMVKARLSGEIPWEWMEDRLRKPRHVSMWNGLTDFGDTVVSSYRKNVWATQPRLMEVWLEKDALSGIFADILDRYGVTLCVGRGYDGWDSINSAAKRYARWTDREGTHPQILYFGDFDPSGEDMVRSLKARLIELMGEEGPYGFRITKCALTPEDIEQYELPPDFTKAGDRRSAKHIARHGDVAVELDALPLDVLEERIESAIKEHMDLDALAGC
jgi:hypothetical protein